MRTSSTACAAAILLALSAFEPGGTMAACDAGIAPNDNLPTMGSAPFANRQNREDCNVKFGDMTPGATRDAVVQVRATRPVAITLSSRNLGVLKHTELKGTAGVPYSLTVDGVPVNLAGSSAPIQRTPELSLDGTSYPMTVTIGDTTGRAAGNYKDRITISVMPQ